eukprot:1195713-Prorocentrum_minimum.AAC.10
MGWWPGLAKGMRDRGSRMFVYIGRGRLPTLHTKLEYFCRVRHGAIPAIGMAPAVSPRVGSASSSTSKGRCHRPHSQRSYCDHQRARL